MNSEHVTSSLVIVGMLTVLGFLGGKALYDRGYREATDDAQRDRYGDYVITAKTAKPETSYVTDTKGLRLELAFTEQSTGQPMTQSVWVPTLQPVKGEEDFEDCWLDMKVGAHLTTQCIGAVLEQIRFGSLRNGY